MKKWFDEKIFSSNKRTLQFISLACFSVLFIYFIILLCFRTYFNSNSDDIVQYMPILYQYIEQFKQGNLGWYNFANNLGASVWADAYYVPLDVFTLLIFLLSFVFDYQIAFSIVNLSKVLLGVVLFGYFLQKKGFKNWIVAVLSLVYFCVGGSWMFATYPTYFSLFFYLPLSLLVVDYYFAGKKWILPLYACLLIFYNFYNAYSLYIFMAFVFVVRKIRDDYSGMRCLVKETVLFGLHIILGVLMGLVILLPSVLYILNYSSRQMSYFEPLFDINVYIRMIYNLFCYNSGVDGFGLTGDYVHQQFSYYVGILGLFSLCLLFFMKDRVSRIYRRTLLVIVVMMCIPAFSMIFSGVMVAYTRWFNFLNIIFLYMIGHVLDVIKWDKVDKKTFNKCFLITIVLYCVSLVSVAISFKNSYSSLAYEETFRFSQILLIVIIFGAFIALYLVFYFSKKKDLIFSVFSIEMIVALSLNLMIGFNNKGLDMIEMDNYTKEVYDKLDLDNELARVYFYDNATKYNLSRRINGLTNEETFHSFMTKYVYDFDKYYNEQEQAYLVTSELNRFNPYASRIMDYKYVVVAKDENVAPLDYLDVFYEENDYIVYVNKAYNPFYVYESYYSEDEVLEQAENISFMELERALFEGVILENEQHNLIEENFNLEDNLISTLNIVDKANPQKGSDNVYVLNIDDYSDAGDGVSVVIKIEDAYIDKMYVIINGEKKECESNFDSFTCNIEEGYERIEFVSYEDVENVQYYVINEEKDIKYNVFKISGNDRYLHYYTTYGNGVFVRDNLMNERECFNGLCIVDNFEEKYLYIKDPEILKSDEEKKFNYYYDDLQYYKLNKDDKCASNKELTYDRSTLNIKYTRVSNSLYDQVVVLPVMYSEEWVLEENENFELVRANGSYLGVKVKNGVNEININIKFKPSGVTIGLVGTLLGIGIYGVYCSFIYLRHKRREENILRGSENE